MNDEHWILDCFDALQGCQNNYMAVFGVSYIDLPEHVRDDLKALLKRQEQLKAMHSGR